jgi:hypothetical protein
MQLYNRLLVYIWQCHDIWHVSKVTYGSYVAALVNTTLGPINKEHGNADGNEAVHDPDLIIWPSVL